MSIRAALLALLAPPAFSAAACGQSINIDFGPASSAPSSVFAGAGEPGYWNAVEFLHREVPIDLRGLGGQPTQVFAVAPLDSYPVFRTLHPGTTGDNEALFDDYIPGRGDIHFVLRLFGLRNGEYAVVIHGWSPIRPDLRTFAFALDGSQPQPCPSGIGGEWTGKLDVCLTHVVSMVRVDDGELSIIARGGDITEGGEVNGIQLVLLESIGCPADFNSDGVIDSRDFFEFIHAFFASFGADFNGDLVIDSRDFFAFIDAFFAGCP